MDSISDIQAQLADNAAAIADTEAKKRAATTLSDIAGFDDDLVSLKAQRTVLQLKLANLQAAGDQVAAIQPVDAGVQAAAIRPADTGAGPKRKRARH